MSRPLHVVTKDDQLASQARLRSYLKETPGGQELITLSRSVLVQLGQEVWPHTFRLTDSDEVASELWHAHIESLSHDPVRQFLYLQQTRLSDATILRHGGARWIAEGLPVYRLGHKQAALLMATSVSPEMAEFIKPPSRAFHIEIPPGLIDITGTRGDLQPIKGVFVQVITLTAEHHGAAPGLPAGEYWRWICTTRCDLTLWECNRYLHELITGAIIPEDEYFGIGWELDDRDYRARRLVTRLIVSFCLDVASGKTWKTKYEPVAPREGKKAPKGGLQYRVMLDPAEAEVDARPFVHAFLEGERKSPAFQQMVGTHWKSQAYGPSHSLRRPIKILAYKRLEHLPEKPSEP